jgi:hypothetical protein
MSKTSPKQRIETLKDWLTTTQAFKGKRNKTKNKKR